MTALGDVRRLRLDPGQVIELFAALVAKAGAATQFVGGSIGFRVHGRGGGTWVLELSTEGGRLVEVGDADFEAAGTRIYAFARDFAALVVAPDAIVGLLETGRFVVEGDKDKLGRLSKLIRTGTGQSQIGVRAGGNSSCLESAVNKSGRRFRTPASGTAASSIRRRRSPTGSTTSRS